MLISTGTSNIEIENNNRNEIEQFILGVINV